MGNITCRDTRCRRGQAFGLIPRPAVDVQTRGEEFLPGVDWKAIRLTGRTARSHPGRSYSSKGVLDTKSTEEGALYPGTKRSPKSRAKLS